MSWARQVVRIAIWRVGDGDAPLPAYMTPGASGCDLAAAIDEPLTLAPLERCLVPSGVAIALPEGFEAQVRPRSGLAVREGITVLNAPGTIDSDYRGEIKVALVNLSNEAHTIVPGDRIAQLVVAPVARAEWLPVSAGSAEQRAVAGEALYTERGSGGFGHTGSSSPARARGRD
jgi:dUTP pyrophosphatase